MISPLQPYDLVMLAVLMLNIGFGAWKGMAWQVAALGSFILSAAAAVHLSGPLAPLISVQSPWNRCIAMLILYLATSLAIWVLFRLVAGLIDRVELKEFDRQAGALFGTAKGVLWCAAITFFAVTLVEPARNHILGSHSGRFTAVLIHRAAPLLPTEIREIVGRYIDQFDRRMSPDLPSDPGDQPVVAGGGIRLPRPRFAAAFRRRADWPAAGVWASGRPEPGPTREPAPGPAGEDADVRKSLVFQGFDDSADRT